VSKGVFTDINVRKAFREGIDWQTIVNKLYFGQFQPAKGPLSPATVGYDKSIEPAYTYNVDNAKKLLDAAGWTGRDGEGYRTKDGVRLTVLHPFLKAYTREQRDTLADQIQAAAKQIGIYVNNTNPDLSTYLADIGKGNYDLADFSWQRSSPDALRTLFGIENLAKGGFGTNLSTLSDPAIQQDLVDALATTDLGKQAQLYGDAQRRITEAVAVFPVYVFNYLLGSSTKVRGVAFEPQAFPTFYDAWKTS
jgi:peptide/nickel transport system substrate-binding protein